MAIVRQTWALGFGDVVIDYGWIEWHTIFVEYWGVLGRRYFDNDWGAKKLILYKKIVPI